MAVDVDCTGALGSSLAAVPLLNRKQPIPNIEKMGTLPAVFQLQIQAPLWSAQYIKIYNMYLKVTVEQLNPSW